MYRKSCKRTGTAEILDYVMSTVYGKIEIAVRLNLLVMDGLCLPALVILLK